MPGPVEPTGGVVHVALTVVGDGGVVMDVALAPTGREHNQPESLVRFFPQLPAVPEDGGPLYGPGTPRGPPQPFNHLGQGVASSFVPEGHEKHPEPTSGATPMAPVATMSPAGLAPAAAMTPCAPAPQAMCPAPSGPATPSTPPMHGPLLPPLRNPDLKTLVLDLDCTLIASEDEPHAPAPFAYCVDDERFVWLRPGVRQFLAAVRPHYEVVLFTAAGQAWADRALQHLDPHGTLFDARLWREHTVVADGYGYVKDLSRLGRELSRVVIVEDNPASALYQPDNALHVQGYDPQLLAQDDVLAQTLDILLGKVLHAADVRDVLRELRAPVRPSAQAPRAGQEYGGTPTSPGPCITPLLQGTRPQPSSGTCTGPHDGPRAAAAAQPDFTFIPLLAEYSRMPSFAAGPGATGPWPAGLPGAASAAAASHPIATQAQHRPSAGDGGGGGRHQAPTATSAPKAKAKGGTRDGGYRGAGASSPAGVAGQGRNQGPKEPAQAHVSPSAAGSNNSTSSRATAIAVAGAAAAAASAASAAAAAVARLQHRGQAHATVPQPNTCAAPYCAAAAAAGASSSQEVAEWPHSSWPAAAASPPLLAAAGAGHASVGPAQAGNGRRGGGDGNTTGAGGRAHVRELRQSTPTPGQDGSG